MKQRTGNTNPRGRGRTLLIALVLLILYAYAVQVTRIDLDEPLEATRQRNLVSMLRELARPDLFTYATETVSTDLSIRMPCPEDVKASQISSRGRTFLLAPNCASTTQDVLVFQGSGLPPNESGVLRWYPAGAETTRTLVQFESDADGEARVTFTMPDIRETAEPQRIEIVEVTSRQLTGLSETAYLAMAAIVETVLMALMASTIGTLLAIPISFMAAQNLMRDVRLPLAAIMGSLILALLGAAAGGWLGAQVLALSRLVSNPWLALGVLLLAGGAAAWLLRSLVLEDDEAAGGSPLARTVGVALVGALGLLALALLAQLGEAAGSWLTPRLGVLGFTANFILVLGNLVTLLFPALVGFVGLLLGGTWGGRLGQEAVLQLPDGTARGLTALLGVIGTALFVLVLGYGLIWLNVLGVRDLVPETAAGQLALLAWPAAVLGVLVGVLALRRAAKRPYPIGLTTYTVVRGTLNGLRSIEPLMMGFVFVVWVGLGPFAGILALTLHSIADLGKLFSEEVENIDEGPREAITATGASGVQTVVYAVVPQITPHYIAYIFYRWDINVRMSTVIGFVGGGGIGFVLQRFLNLTQYSRASVMVIAIALVVTILDTISSRIRTRII